MPEDDIDVDDIVEQHKEDTEGGRTGTEAAVEKNDGDEDKLPELEDAIADAYQKIDDNDLSSNLTLRDENLAALFHGLENADQLADVGEAAANELNRDPDDTESRAATLRLLVRIALKEVDDSLLESGKEGRRRFLESDEF
ncbi:hypothetical protein JMJ58_21190 (plasmid) [Haloterrigena salifodinae]|uniref:DUF8115 domain-containing protein n=1 Tax=Haloterrigena salifodinae TaxID=2675099 RepID=A0A8T8E7N5_9EURY|nr:hypothetical protein [Haloterrigena salifodinae]QRV17472.1 hypothetical protein JMJ58_21190 [Haloterrigena salifodinae]